jgi:glycosyltransferase involved in cell wall biosynthesis
MARRLSVRARRNSLGNSLAAGTVLVRHLAKGTPHVGTLPQPWRTPTYLAAAAALEGGDLTEAERLASSAGPGGAVLRRLIAGELGVLTAAGRPVTTRSQGDRLDHRDRRPVACSHRVLHLVTNSLPETVAGYTIRTQGIARAQRAAGLDVHVATRIGFPVTKGHLDADDRLTVDGIDHHRVLPVHLPLRADAALRKDIELTARLVESLRPAVLHAHSNHLNAQVALALRERFGIPVVYEVRGFLEETWRSRSTNPHAESADAYRLARAAETQCLRAADAVVTLSEVMREAIIARGVDPDRVTVVPNCVDQAFVETAATAASREVAFAGNPTEWVGLLPAKGTAREAVSEVSNPTEWVGLLPPKRTAREAAITVGTVGTLNAYEGIDVLIDAVAWLRHCGHDVHLRVVGDGPERTALEKRAADRVIADTTTFTGRVPHDQVAAQHQAIDVFCVPRHDLPVTRLVPPLKPVEAMALGRPVVASDLPPLRELLGPDGDGFQRRGLLVPAGDSQALADALVHLIDAPDVRRQLGANAHDWVARTRTWSAAAQTYEQIYTRIQGETP